MSAIRQLKCTKKTRVPHQRHTRLMTSELNMQIIDFILVQFGSLLGLWKFCPYSDSFKVESEIYYSHPSALLSINWPTRFLHICISPNTSKETANIWPICFLVLSSLVGFFVINSNILPFPGPHWNCSSKNRN